MLFQWDSVSWLDLVVIRVFSSILALTPLLFGFLGAPLTFLSTSLARGTLRSRQSLVKAQNWTLLHSEAKIRLEERFVPVCMAMTRILGLFSPRV